MKNKTKFLATNQEKLCSKELIDKNSYEKIYKKVTETTKEDRN